MKVKIKRKLKKLLNLYNLAIAACVVLIVVALCVMLKPDSKEETSKASNNTKVAQSEKKDNKKQIKEEKAREIAKKRFEQLGENDVKESELDVKKITRNGEDSYFISSTNNTLEVRATDGKIIRINSVVVDE